MKVFLIVVLATLTPMLQAKADTIKEVSFATSLSEVQKLKDQARARIVHKLDKYKKKLEEYLTIRGQDELTEGTSNEYSVTRADVQNRIKALDARKQKMLDKVEKKYDFSTVQSAKSTIEKINRKLKVIKEDAFKDLPAKSIN